MGTDPVLNGRREAPLTIAIDALSAHAGGGAVYLRHQLNALARLVPAWRFLVICTPRNVDVIRGDSPNLHHHLVDSVTTLPTRLWWQYVNLPRFLAEHTADLLYCPGNFCYPHLSIPQLLTLQNINHFADLALQPTWSLKLKRLLQRWGSQRSIRWADATLFISRDYYQTVARQMALDEQKSHILYSGVSERFLQPPEPTANHPPDLPYQYLLVVASFARHKNLETTLHAFAQIAPRQPDLHLVVAGGRSDDAYRAEIMRLTTQLGLQTRCRFLGAVPHEQLPPLYAYARCYLSTSLREAFPLTPFEAMSQRVPAILPQTGVFPEICGRAALYIDPRDADDVARGITTLLHDEALRQQLIAEGEQHIAAFTWERHAQKLYAILRGLLDK